MFLTVGAVQSAEAQAPLGARAAGMAGAFVGVADDASAVYWNPAGLATGAYVSFISDLSKWEAPRDSTVPGEPQTGWIVGFSDPSIGIAHFRQQLYLAGPEEPAVSGVPGREEVRRSVHALATSTIGVALLQSLGEHLVIGTTLKVLRGRLLESETKGDVDAGVMMSAGRLRLGLVGRNLTTPAFHAVADGDAVATMERQVRAGGAWGSGWPGRSRVVVAVDADLSTQAAPDGDRRDVAAGVETWWKGQRVGVRAGVRRSMIGEPREVVAAGASYGVSASSFLEAHVAQGRRDERSWSVGARFSF
jgi:hypothetical protein